MMLIFLVKAEIVYFDATITKGTFFGTFQSFYCVLKIVNQFENAKHIVQLQSKIKTLRNLSIDQVKSLS